MFKPVINVYIDGVYDLMHYGHMNMIVKALEHGNRLVIGVVDDGDVADYKRTPVLDQSQRKKSVETFVEACKYVYKIVKCPYPHMDEEFVKKHNIHTIVCSEEYNPELHAHESDFVDYYKIPRTDGISTSKVIKSIKNRSDL